MEWGHLPQVALGQVLHQLDDFLPFGRSVPLDDLLAIALLVFFGVRTLQAGALGACCPVLCCRVGALVLEAMKTCRKQELARTYKRHCSDLVFLLFHQTEAENTCKAHTLLSKCCCYFKSSHSRLIPNAH